MPSRERALPILRAGLWTALILGASSAVGAFTALGRAGPAAAADDAMASEARTWVAHVVVAGETYEDIALRYGVKKSEILRWNESRLPPNKWLRVGGKLRIHARIVPPTRERLEHVVEKGETWDAIAMRYAVSTDQLRRWNRAVPKRFRSGTKLVVWASPPPVAVAEAVTTAGLAPLPQFSIPVGALSLGRPSRGRLSASVQLPESDMYVVKKPDAAFGSSHTVRVVVEAIARFRRDARHEQPLEIGAMSRRGGGRLRPHRSHQSGRDVDVWLPKRDGIPLGKPPRVDEVDWPKAWALLRSFLDSGEIEYVFFEYRLQRRLLELARAQGLPAAELERIFQYPRGSRSNQGIVRHAEGHGSHMHVRVKCGAEESGCRSEG